MGFASSLAAVVVAAAGEASVGTTVGVGDGSTIVVTDSAVGDGEGKTSVLVVPLLDTGTFDGDAIGTGTASEGRACVEPVRTDGIAGGSMFCAVASAFGAEGLGPINLSRPKVLPLTRL